MAWFTCYHLSFKIRNIELQASLDVTLLDAFLQVGVRYQNMFPAVMTSIKEDSHVGLVQFSLVCLWSSCGQSLRSYKTFQTDDSC